MQSSELAGVRAANKSLMLDPRVAPGHGVVHRSAGGVLGHTPATGFGSQAA